MLAVMTNPGVTVATVIAAVRAAPAREALAESVVTSVVVQAAAVVTVHVVPASKADRAAMIVPHAQKSRVPWPCPQD
jgi:hypothetical protein